VQAGGGTALIRGCFRSHVVVIFLDWNGKSEEDISQQFGLVGEALSPLTRTSGSSRLINESSEIETKLNADYLKFIRNFQADESTMDHFRRAIISPRDHESNDSRIDVSPSQPELSDLSSPHECSH
jgi:hypothetical protein